VDVGEAEAGLFFFRGKPGAPFAAISPGGGLAYVGSLEWWAQRLETIVAENDTGKVLSFTVGR
jgi:hypothetical protein